MWKKDQPIWVKYKQKEQRCTVLVDKNFVYWKSLGSWLSGQEKLEVSKVKQLINEPKRLIFKGDNDLELAFYDLKDEEKQEIKQILQSEINMGKITLVPRYW